MNTFKKSIIGAMTLLMGVCLTACSDANEYEDAFTDNPSWVNGYTDSLKISHPETMANTQWVRGSGLKINAYGEEVQGFVESLNFVSADSVSVKMSQGATEGTPIAIYSIDGKQYGSAIAEKDRTTIATSLQPGSVAIVKIGEKAVKVLVK